MRNKPSLLLLLSFAASLGPPPAASLAGSGALSPPRPARRSAAAIAGRCRCPPFASGSRNRRGLGGCFGFGGGGSLDLRARRDGADATATDGASAASSASTSSAAPSFPRWDGGPPPPSASSRRSALLRAAAAAAASLVPSSLVRGGVPPALAEEGEMGDSDLQSQLYNPDGSLRDASSAEARTRTVTASFPGGEGEGDASGTALASVDGAGPSSGAGNGVKVSYQLPDKWGSPATGYLDRSEGVNAGAADRITVYQLPGPAVVKTLDTASTVGVAKALGIPTVPGSNPSLLSADLISGRRSKRDGTVYYEFDLAVAPESCPRGQKEDLGLGFCPYDSIVLLGATVVGGRMYGIVVESGREQWKRGSADLKRVRSSFRVEGELEMMEKE